MDGGTLDFGASLASSFLLADSHPSTWSGTVTITNYPQGVDTLRFGTGASALTAGQFSQISFANYGGATGTIDVNGFVTPSAIPEPATTAGLAACVALTFAALRRKSRTRSPTRSQA